MSTAGETSKMTLVESLRDAIDITLSKDSTSSKYNIILSCKIDSSPPACSHMNLFALRPIM